MHDPLRPTFEHSVPGMEAGALVERIHRVLADPETGLPHRRAGQHLLVWLPKGDQHLWSPWLHIDVSNSESEPGTATIFGRFTPAPSLWTGIMFTYLALGFLAVGGGIFGYSQWLVGDAPTALWAVPAAAAAALSIPLGSRTGQRLAREQMSQLSGAVASALPTAGE